MLPAPLPGVGHCHLRVLISFPPHLEEVAVTLILMKRLREVKQLAQGHSGRAGVETAPAELQGFASHAAPQIVKICSKAKMRHNHKTCPPTGPRQRIINGILPSAGGSCPGLDRADVCPLTMSCFANESIWPIDVPPTPNNFSFSLPFWAPAVTVMDTVFTEAEGRGQWKCLGPQRCRRV